MAVRRSPAHDGRWVVGALGGRTVRCEVSVHMAQCCARVRWALLTDELELLLIVEVDGRELALALLLDDPTLTHLAKLRLQENPMPPPAANAPALLRDQVSL